MDPKSALTQGSFCPCPWTGFIMQADGDIKNCVAAETVIGNVNKDSIQSILQSPITKSIKTDMLGHVKNPSCKTCHTKEQGNSLRSNIISNRIYYLKELVTTPYSLYNNVDNFKLETVDLRWRNTCNFACVYCDPVNSSKWASELKVDVHLDNAQRQAVLTYVLDNVKNLKHVYLAGGEPLMINENQILLDQLWQHNPDVSLRVNTNLSSVSTKIFETLCKFKNVHWIISVDETESAFEYVRYGGSWDDFKQNLDIIKKLDHKISFNMLWFVLNVYALFDCIDWLKAQGFHDNSMILGPITGPTRLDVRNVPESVKPKLVQLIKSRMTPGSSWLLEHGYQLLIDHISTPYDGNLEKSLNWFKELDQRRGTNGNKIFPTVYNMLDVL
jgi:radical SAM protein with 4Fe4S-binding SPASM domain